MKEISPKTLQVRPWHSFQADGSERAKGGFWALEVIVPLVIIAIFLVAGAVKVAIVVAAVTVLLWMVRGFSRRGRQWVDKATGVLAQWVAQAVAIILLAPAFYVIMTLVRVLNRLTGRDPLVLRSKEIPTFWVSSDTESRRGRYIKSMFCTERLQAGRLSIVPLAVTGVVLLVAAELGLRLYGFGTPLLYVQDPQVGYYPKPHQRARQPGRVITINNYGMRARDIAAQKTPGHIRVLLLGDSTLAGTWVSNEELYSSLLEQRLNAAAGAPIFEVLNMGVNGWGPLHELGFVKKFGTFGSDVVVMCGPVSNCYRPLYGLDRLPFSPATNPPRLALEQLFHELCWRYRERCLGPPSWLWPECHDTQYRIGIEGYSELARLAKEQGAEVVAEMLPPKWVTMGIRSDPGTDEVLVKLQARLNALGVPVNCAGSIFKDVKPAAKVYHDKVHFDRFGHRLYAEYLADRLSKDSLRIQKAVRGGS